MTSRRMDRDPNRGNRRVPLSWFTAADAMGLNDGDEIDRYFCDCGHRLDRHGPEAAGCIECRCRRFREAAR